MAKDERSTVPATVVDRLFVYGTLIAGQASRSLIGPYVRRALAATARGSIYAFPSGHPGVVPDDRGVVTGELIHLTDLASVLPLLDAFEGDDFIRILVEVTTAEGACWAWIYVLTSPELARLGTRVEHGDWARYLSERD